MSQRRCHHLCGNQSGSEDSSTSSNFHGDNLSSLDVVHSRTQPKWYIEQGAQTESGGYVGPFWGLGIPVRCTTGRGRASLAARGIGDRMRRGCIGRHVYHPRRCGLCDHHRTFDTHTGLNNHSSKQHGCYYSLKGDCFVPLGESVVRVHIPKVMDAQRHPWACGVGPRSRGRARPVQGRTRPPYPRHVQPIRYLGDEDGHFVMPQIVRSGVVTVGL